MEKRRGLTTRQIVFAGIMAALVFAASWIQINIPIGADNTRVHLGNTMCVLAALMLGGPLGGCAAGIGSAVFDLTNPLYISSVPFTFAFKFVLGLLAGLISHGGKKPGTARDIVGAVVGSAAYCLLYLAKSYGKNRIVYLMEPGPALVALSTKVVATTVNAVIAIVIAVPLAMLLRAALKRAHLEL